MTFTNAVLIGVALFAILGALAAFGIAYQRSRPPEDETPGSGLSDETLRADKSMEGVRVEPIPDEGSETDAQEAAVEQEMPASVSPAVAVVETQRVVEVSPEESGVSRRQFFNRALGGAFFAFLGLQGVYYLAFFWPKLSGGFGTDVDAGDIAEISGQVFTSDGAILPLFVPDARAYVVPAPPVESEQFAGTGVQVNNLQALFQRCVHLGCRVPWCGPSQGFECPCHGSKYNSVGEYFAGPAPRNLDRFEVENRGGRLIIKTGTIVETPRAPSLTTSYPQGPSCIGA